MVVDIDYRTHRFQWLPILVIAALTVSLAPAVEMRRPPTVPGTPAGVAGSSPVLRSLPAEARPNAAPKECSPVVPPVVPAAGAPRALSAADLASIPGAAPAGQVATTAEVVFEDLVLRPGYTIGDTSFVAYYKPA